MTTAVTDENIKMTTFPVFVHDCLPKGKDADSRSASGEVESLNDGLGVRHGCSEPVLSAAGGVQNKHDIKTTGAGWR